MLRAGPLKYQSERGLTNAANAAELLTVKLRYKRPDAENSQLLSRVVVDEGKRIEQASIDFRWAAAVAGFGMVLRQSDSAAARPLRSCESWPAPRSAPTRTAT